MIGLLLRKCRRCRVVGMLLVCCARAERRGWRERERTKISRLARTPRPLLNCDDQQSTITSLARRRLRIFEPKRRRCRARPLGNGKRVGPSGRTQPFFVVVVGGERARVVARCWWRVRLHRRCVRDSVLCARLDAVCARAVGAARCVCDSRFTQYFFGSH